MHRFRLDMTLVGALVILIALGPRPASATRVKDLCEVQGARGNDLIGTGIVVGLSGTGDKAPAAIRAQDRMLDRLDIDVASLGELKSDNVAIVIVTATLPAFAKEGTRMDVRVSSLYDCKSLEGGTLLKTFLYGGNGKSRGVYAVAQGPVSVGGFAAGAGGGAGVRKNIVTAGRIPMGAYIEREVPSTITDGERIMLILKTPDFGTADNIRKGIDAGLGSGAAMAMGAGAVVVTIPEAERSDLTSFIARVQQMDAQVDVPARIVINERTGTIVVGGDVMIRPCQIAHGNLSIKVAKTPQVSQPLPFSPGETVKTEVAELVVEEQEAYLMPVEGTTAGDVAEALNRLKVTPRDMISIFQALREAGALLADLEIM